MIQPQFSGGLSRGLLLHLRQHFPMVNYPTPLSDSQVQALSPVALAYIGDAVYELFVRMGYLFPPQRPQQFHRQVVEQVRAERQAEVLALISEHLTEQERDVVRRGRNASSRGPRRLDPLTYQRATSLETLLGYLYLTDTARLGEILDTIALGAMTPKPSADPRP